MRRGGKGLAWLAVVLNILPILQVGLSFVDAIHMTFYPQGGWLIW